MRSTGERGHGGRPIASASLLAVVLGLVSALAVACGDGGDSSGGAAPAKPKGSSKPAASAPPSPAASDPATITAADRDSAREIFEGRCVTCHGAKGKGDGPASAGLNPKPRDLSSSEWQAEVTDEHIEKIIMYGGAAVGRSPMMPGNPDLASKKAVVAALREYIRELDG